MTGAIYADEYDLFSLSTPKFKIDKPIRLIELFAGIGSQAKALQNLKADFVRWKVVEFDKYAIASYNAIHGTQFECMDIKDVHAADLEIKDTDKYCYIVTYSFPCQDLSIAGAQKGMTKGSNTRSGLLWEVERILDECEILPQVLLMENVPQVIGKRNIKDFQSWRLKLERLGYSNFVQLLNAKDYGVPQNRNRCFMVSILGNYSYQFPAGYKLEKRLKDLLEDNVDEHYFISQRVLDYFIKNTHDQKKNGNGYRFKPTKKADADIARVIATSSAPRMDDNYIQDLELQDTKKIRTRVVGTLGINGFESTSRVHDINYISPTITTMNGGGHEPKIKTIAKNNMRIRKLTPRECWRLMAFTDEDFGNAKKVNSDSQLYKQAGNSIVVKVLEEIFKQMLGEQNV